MAETGLSDAQLAERLGVDRSTITRLRNGSARPSWQLAEKIARETRGKVTPNDFARARVA